MTHVFLSHNSIDNPQVIRLARDLLAAGVNVWLDVFQLQPGDWFGPKLQTALDDSSVVLGCIGGSGPGPWQERELQDADARKKEVIVVLLPGWSQSQKYLGNSGRVAVGLHENWDINFHALVKTLRQFPPLFATPLALDKPRLPGGPFDGNPYPGINHVFEAEHAAWFFGRETSTAEIVLSLQRRNWTWLVGNSASGKSSVARAGVMAWWPRALSSVGIACVFEPSERPNEDLAGALARACVAAGGTEPDVAAHADAPSRWTATLRARFGGSANRPPILVVVDQLERVFSKTGLDAKGAAMLSTLHELTEDTALDLRVLAVLRADWLDRVLNEPAFRPMLDNARVELSLEGMSDAGLRDAIMIPARLAGGRVKNAVADALIRGVRQSEHGLSLMQFVLQDAWNRTEEGLIRRELLADLPLDDAIGKYIESQEPSFAKSLDEDRLAVLVPLLVEFNDRNKPRCKKLVGRDVDKHPDAHRIRTDLDALARTRVLVAMRSVESVPVSSAIDKAPTGNCLQRNSLQDNFVSAWIFAHDSVLGAWAALRHAIGERESLLRMMMGLERLFDDDVELSGPTLEKYRHLVGEPSLRSDHRKFLRSAIRRQKWQRYSRGLILAVAACAIGVTFYVRYRRNAAESERERQAQIARETSKRLQEFAVKFRDSGQVEKAALLSVQMLTDAKTDLDRFQSAATLYRALTPASNTELAQHLAPARFIAAEERSGDLRIISAGLDGQIAMYSELEKSTILMGIMGVSTTALRVSRDRPLVVVASSTGHVTTWDLTTLDSGFHAQFQPTPVRGLDTCRGEFAVAYDELLYLGDLRTGEAFPVAGHASAPTALEYSPGCEFLVATTSASAKVYRTRIPGGIEQLGMMYSAAVADGLIPGLEPLVVVDGDGKWNGDFRPRWISGRELAVPREQGLRVYDVPDQQEESLSDGEVGALFARHGELVWAERPALEDGIGSSRVRVYVSKASVAKQKRRPVQVMALDSMPTRLGQCREAVSAMLENGGVSHIVEVDQGCADCGIVKVVQLDRLAREYVSVCRPLGQPDDRVARSTNLTKIFTVDESGRLRRWTSAAPQFYISDNVGGIVMPHVDGDFVLWASSVVRLGRGDRLGESFGWVKPGAGGGAGGGIAALAMGAGDVVVFGGGRNVAFWKVSDWDRRRREKIREDLRIDGTLVGLGFAAADVLVGSTDTGDLLLWSRGILDDPERLEGVAKDGFALLKPSDLAEEGATAIASLAEGRVRLFDTSGTPRGGFDAGPEVRDVHFVQRGKGLLGVAENWMRVWSLDGVASTTKLPGSPRLKAVVSRSGASVATLGDRTVSIWHLEPEPSTQPIELLHGGVVGALAWAPDDRTILTGDSQGRVSIYAVEGGVEPAVFDMGRPEPLKVVAWSASGEHVAGVGGREVQIWDLSVERLAGLGCGVARGETLRDEWPALYGEERSYEAACPKEELTLGELVSRIKCDAGGARCRVPSSLVHALLPNAGDIFARKHGDSRWKPAVSGWELYQLPPAGILAAVGLRDADIVMTINDIALTSDEAILGLFAEAGRTRSFRIKFLREGASMQLLVEVES